MTYSILGWEKQCTLNHKPEFLVSVSAETIITTDNKDDECYTTESLFEALEQLKYLEQNYESCDWFIIIEEQ